MRPYYDHAGITIYHADCLELQGQLEADVVVTDPPFGIEGGSGGGNRQRGKGRYAATGWEDTPNYIARHVAPSLMGTVERIGRAAFTPGRKHMHVYTSIAPPADIGGFWSPAAVGFGPWGSALLNPILYYGRDPRAGISQVASGRTCQANTEALAHPCPKPLREWTWLVAKASLEDEMVIDPFMGSGTTLVAAKNLGRRAIGIEIEERYCEIAAERLAQEVMAL